VYVALFGSRFLSETNATSETAVTNYKLKKGALPESAILILVVQIKKTFWV